MKRHEFDHIQNTLRTLDETEMEAYIHELAEGLIPHFLSPDITQQAPVDINALESVISDECITMHIHTCIAAPVNQEFTITVTLAPDPICRIPDSNETE